MAIAKGKINASRVQAGDRILVLVREDGSVTWSGTKTGAGVQVARVTGKSTGESVTSWGTRTNRMTYNVHTSAGIIRNLAPIQTMWLAPEDPAGIKRAHAEALALEAERAERAEAEEAARFAEEHPTAVIAHTVRPSASSPEVGWSSQCRAERCPGHWRTGLGSAKEAREAYRAHRCAEAPAPERTREDEPAGRFTLEEALAAVGMTPDPLDDREVTDREALAAIGRCWAGGALTGKALTAWHNGDHRLALALAMDQQKLQEAGGPDALHPEERERAARHQETLGQVAADILAMTEEDARQVLKEVEAARPELRGEPAPEEGPTDWVQRLRPDAGADPVMVAAGRDYLRQEEHEARQRAAMGAVPAFTQVGPGVYVAPMGSPAPGPEDLADLALALAAEDLEHLDPEEVRTPKVPPYRAQPQDVVTIHRGDRLYLVERVEEDYSTDRITGDRTDHTLARVAPLDPEDHRDAQWVHVDLLHVRKPLGSFQTVEVTGRVRQTREVFRVEGRDRLAVIRTILVDSRRLPEATLAEVPSFPVGQEPTLRVGEAVTVDGRTFQVELDEEERLVLKPARHRARLG